MKTLYLLRHAKSSWLDTDLADFDRPLNDRGLRTAPFMGGVMQKNGYIPAIVLSSPAMRAKQTAELVVKEAHLGSEVLFDDRIYEASPQSLKLVVSEVDEKFTSAMLVGHNPGIEGFIRYMTGKLEPMPTATLAVIDLNIETWFEVSANCGKLIKVIRPKDELKSLGISN